MSTDVIVPLSKPIKAHDEELSQLTLREPTTEEVMEEGYPFLVVTSKTGDSGVELRPKVVARYVMKLSGIPLSSVKQLSVPDLQRCQVAVMGFFGEGPDQQS